MRQTAKDAARRIWRKDAGNGFTSGTRSIPEETPIAITYDGSSHAVMMATPADLEDFAIGFSLFEGIIDSPDDLESLEIVDVEDGIEARMWLKQASGQRHIGRRRAILGPTGCGLCGVESISEAMKPLRRIDSGARFEPEQLIAAMGRMQKAQTLNQQTRAVHAAGYWDGGKTLIVREDVGRHNALDKVIGAAARAGIDCSRGAILMTSRVSVELVQKTARLGAPMIAAVSAPTSLAVRLAEDAGITLIAVLREDGFEVFTHAQRVLEPLTQTDRQ
ncbi:MAG: formate dehydrogenase accessory sulfurtransferase FdhD [Rhodomicrobium sp.]|nr:formate dehydrogenase accessory sulfurtransferase FdhD [Rhodomicrobium sp.]